MPGVKDKIFGAVAATFDFLLAFATARPLRKLGEQPFPAPDPTVMVKSTIAPMAIVYGQALLSGVLTYVNTRSTPGTNNDRDLHYLVSLTGHEVEDIVTVWLDADEIATGDVNWDAGPVTGGKYFFNGNGKLEFWKKLGTSTDVAFSELTSAYADWTSAHKLLGIAKILVRFQLANVSSQVYASGPPTNVKGLVKGRKIYDVRKDSTNGGSGTHRLADDTTWEWSSNGALCVADYLINYVGVASGRIDWPTVILTADVCDELVAIPTAATEKRYTCNGVLHETTPHGDNIIKLLSSFNGDLVQSGGNWYILTDDYTAPSVTLTDGSVAGEPDNFVGNIIVKPPDSVETFNTVHGTFVDPTDQYNERQFIEVVDATMVTRDGQELLKELDLPMTNSETMAQRLALMQLELTDQKLTTVVDCDLTAWQLKILDRVSMTVSEFSWSAKAFQVIDFELVSTTDAQGEPINVVRLTCQEDSSSAHDDPAESKYGTRTAFAGVVLGTPDPPAPSNLAVVGALLGFSLRWTNPTTRDLWDKIAIYASPNSAWANATKVGESRTDNLFIPATPGSLRYWWIRAEFDTAQSDRFPNSDTSGIVATAGALDDAQPIVRFRDGTIQGGHEGDERPGGDVYTQDGAQRLIDTTLGVLDTLIVDTSNIAPDAITVTEIADDAVTTPKLIANAVIADKIAALTIIADLIAANAIIASKIAAGAVVAGKIAANAITAAGGEIADLAVNRLMLSSDTGGELFTADLLAEIRFRLGIQIGGYEGGDERFGGDLYTQDLNTRVIDAIAGEVDQLAYSTGNIMDGLEPAQTGATANTGPFLADSFLLASNDWSMPASSGDVDKWAVHRDGSAPITVLSSTHFRFDEAGIYLVMGQFNIQLTTTSVTGTECRGSFAAWVDTGSGYVKFRDIWHEFPGNGQVLTVDATKQFVFIVNAGVNDQLKFTGAYSGAVSSGKLHGVVFSQTGVEIIQLKHIKD